MTGTQAGALMTAVALGVVLGYYSHTDHPLTFTCTPLPAVKVAQPVPAKEVASMVQTNEDVDVTKSSGGYHFYPGQRVRTPYGEVLSKKDGTHCAWVRQLDDGMWEATPLPPEQIPETMAFGKTATAVIEYAKQWDSCQ